MAAGKCLSWPLLRAAHDPRAASSRSDPSAAAPAVVRGRSRRSLYRRGTGGKHPARTLGSAEGAEQRSFRLVALARGKQDAEALAAFAALILEDGHARPPVIRRAAPANAFAAPMGVIKLKGQRLSRQPWTRRRPAPRETSGAPAGPRSARGERSGPRACPGARPRARLSAQRAAPPRVPS